MGREIRYEVKLLFSASFSLPLIFEHQMLLHSAPSSFSKEEITAKKTAGLDFKKKKTYQITRLNKSEQLLILSKQTSIKQSKMLPFDVVISERKRLVTVTRQNMSGRLRQKMLSATEIQQQQFRDWQVRLTAAAASQVTSFYTYFCQLAYVEDLCEERWLETNAI